MKMKSEKAIVFIRSALLIIRLKVCLHVSWTKYPGSFEAAIFR